MTDTVTKQGSESGQNEMPYYLGCPMWGNPEWKQRFFLPGSTPSQFLSQYSSVFNSVEGNTTFYGLPSESTIKLWHDEAATGFHFCFKFPQRITHGKKLLNAAAETEKFLLAMDPIGEHLGPFFIQLAPDFSPAYLETLSRFMSFLPDHFDYTVEVRHTDFFHDTVVEQELNDLLISHNADRVVFDTRPLFSARPSSDAVRDAQKKKPRVPATSYALGKHPTLRFIGHPDGERSREYFAPWLRKVAGWIAEGRKPYVFIHTPDNADAPHLALDFHQGLQALVTDLEDLPGFPVVRENDAKLAQQLNTAKSDTTKSPAKQNKTTDAQSSRAPQLDLF